MTKLSKATLKIFWESGLTAEHAAQMGIRDVGTEELIRLFPDYKKVLREEQVIGHEIPYFGLDKKATGYARYRLYGCDKLPKYLQPKGAKSQLYFPPFSFLDWEKIAADTSIPLCLTEGERKAAKACLSGIITAGLGGVWNWLGKEG